MKIVPTNELFEIGECFHIFKSWHFWKSDIALYFFYTLF